MSDREDAPDSPDHTADGTAEADARGESTGVDAPSGEADVAEVKTDAEAEIPVWDDEYVERVSGRLMYNFDLEKDRRVVGERFTLYGRMEITSQKHFFHPALNYANQRSTEHLFVRRTDGVGVSDLERFVDLGHELADEWIDPDEEHYGTDFTFALVAPQVREDVREFVAGFKDRTLLKYGYNGHYEINLLVVAPDAEEIVTSRSTDLDRAFALWESPEEESSGLLGRLF